MTFLVASVVFALNAHAAQKPYYDFSTSEVYGSYEQLSKDSCTDEQNRPCVGAVIKTIKGQPFIDIKDYGRELIPLVETKKGNLVFKWENPEADDCDDGGCWNLLGLSGVVYAKKKGTKYVPAVRVFVKKDYPFPDEEGSPEGEVTETETFIKRK